jgi:hypothetical protein
VVIIAHSFQRSAFSKGGPGRPVTRVGNLEL